MNLRPEFLRAISISLILGLLCAGIAFSQKPAASPNRDAMYEHIMKAKKAAGIDLEHHFYHRCLVDPNYSRTIARHRKATAPMEPVKAFDNIYFLGHNGVASWALQTSEGFMIFDTLESPDEAKQYIEGGMRKLGLDPAMIKYVLVTHEHGDHYAGAIYLRDTFGARLIASKIAWDAMAQQAKAPPRQAAPADAGQPAPPADWAKLAPQLRSNDIAVVDGQKFTFGDTVLTFYITPGHADGALTTIFKTTDHGAPHVVGFLGGLGSPNTEANRSKHIHSLTRFRPIAQAAGVDTLIANHQGQDYAVENLEFIKIRHDDDPNPFSIGKDAYLRYLDIQMECARVSQARNGEKATQ